MKTGRNTKYSPEIVAIICNAIKELKGRCGAAKEAGISFETFCVWMRTKPDFSDAVKKAEREARQKGKEIAIMSIFRAMPTQWQSGAWWLERKHNKQFSLKSKQEIDQKITGTVSLLDLHRQASTKIKDEN